MSAAATLARFKGALRIGPNQRRVQAAGSMCTVASVGLSGDLVTMSIDAISADTALAIIDLIRSQTLSRTGKTT